MACAVGAGFNGLRFGAAFVLACVAATSATNAAPGMYEIDPEHATVAFFVAHIGYAKVLGRFTAVHGTFEFEEETGELNDVAVTVAAASVTTDHEARDRHVRESDFLDAEQFPEIVFTAARAQRTGERMFEITGELTLLGNARPLVLQATLNKSAEYPIGDRAHVLGVSARGRLSRSEFGMTYGVANDLVGDEVEIIIEIEARRR
jgi:polyisoprenoid-binding protein YceI